MKSRIPTGTLERLMAAERYRRQSVTEAADRDAAFAEGVRRACELIDLGWSTDAVRRSTYEERQNP